MINNPLRINIQSLLLIRSASYICQVMRSSEELSEDDLIFFRGTATLEDIEACLWAMKFWLCLMTMFESIIQPNSVNSNNARKKLRPCAESWHRWYEYYGRD
uniref:Uncharacterized protein n=1 Tax=Salmonella sp. TaxID=599 RepID=A0A482ET70_SALSP|nr:hypothetical protein NNIBIDOC_00040 [Salmonella sp.]